MLYIKRLSVSIFYVNNIMFVFLVERLRMVEAIVVESKKRYNFTGGGDL